MSRKLQINYTISYFLSTFNALCMYRKIRYDDEFENFYKFFLNWTKPTTHALVLLGMRGFSAGVQTSACENFWRTSTGTWTRSERLAPPGYLPMGVRGGWVALSELLPLSLFNCRCWCAYHKFDSICRKYVQHLYLQINLLKN